MSPWKILGVGPDADARTIKLAYSKRLKKTRPEDDPEGFTALHHAYKSALAVAKRRSAVEQTPATKEAEPYNRVDKTTPAETHMVNTAQPAPGYSDQQTPEPIVETLAKPDPFLDQAEIENPASQVVHSTAESHSEEPTPPVVDTVTAPEYPDEEAELNSVDSSQPEVYQQPDYQQALDKDFALIQATVTELIASPRRRNKVANWRFIESVPSMVDLHFNAQVSDWIFGVVSEANAAALQKGDLNIQRLVLCYLNDFFQWESHWQQFEETYGDERSNAVFNFTSANRENASNLKLHYFARILAFGVDMIIGGMCFYIATQAPNFSFMKEVSLIYFLIVIPLMEASPLQASIGKKMFQLVVVDKSGLRLQWYHSFLRSYVSYGCLLAIKLVVWINMYTSYKYQKLLQDLISGSSVIERK